MRFLILGIQTSLSDFCFCISFQLVLCLICWRIHDGLQSPCPPLPPSLGLSYIYMSFHPCLNNIPRYFLYIHKRLTGLSPCASKMIASLVCLSPKHLSCKLFNRFVAAFIQASLRSSGISVYKTGTITFLPNFVSSSTPQRVVHRSIAA